MRSGTGAAAGPSGRALGGPAALGAARARGRGAVRRAEEGPPGPGGGGPPRPPPSFQTRLSSLIANAPRNIERDLGVGLVGKPVAWVSLFGLGMMSANGLTLAMGAKSVIDIVASSFTFIVMEQVNRFVWRARRRTFWHWCLMSYKWGLLYQFILDGQFKLNGALGILPPIQDGLVPWLQKLNPISLWLLGAS